MLRQRAQVQVLFHWHWALSLAVVAMLGGSPAQRSFGQEYSDFGVSLATAGDFLVVGADGDQESGAAYVFQRKGKQWSLNQRLAAAKPTRSIFGRSVAIDDGLIVVGDHSRPSGFSSGVGAAYVFEAKNGQFAKTESSLLMMPVPRPNVGFGDQVAVNGGLVAVSAPADGDGAVYLFQKKGGRWLNVRKLTGQGDPQDLFGSFFGNFLAMNDKFLVVGASTQKVAGLGSCGAVYVFRRKDDGSISDPPQRLTPLEEHKVEGMGSSLAIDETSILTGATAMDGPGGVDQGGALLYTAGADGVFQSEPTTVYIAIDGQRKQNAGSKVALTKDFVFVASSVGASESECVEIYPRTGSGGKPPVRLRSDISKVPPYFGSSLLSFEDQIFVGARAFNHEGQVVGFQIGRDGQWKQSVVLTRNSLPVRAEKKR